jgi:hypothetical protein
VMGMIGRLSNDSSGSILGLPELEVERVGL